MLARLSHRDCQKETTKTEEIQRQMRQHSSLINLLGKVQVLPCRVSLPQVGPESARRAQTKAHNTDEYRNDCVDFRPLAEANKMDYDTTGYDEISNGMKNMLVEVGLMKEVIEENTLVLIISGWMTLPNIADVPATGLN